MISALSGAGSRALLSLFGRPKSQAPADDISQVAAQDAARSATSNALPDANRGVPSANLFAALVDQAGTTSDLGAQAIAALDRDGSGTLSGAELTQAYQSVASTGTFGSVAGLVSNIMASVDSDGDGAISGAELSQALAQVTQGAAPGDEGTARLLDQVVAQLDADGNGALSRNEIAQALGLPSDALPGAALGIETRPSTAPRSMYESIFSMRVNPEGGAASAEARAVIAAQLQDKLMG